MSTALSLQLIVPVQYASGVAASQTDSLEMPFFDQNPNTTYTIGTFGDCDITLQSSVIAKWLFVDSDAQYRSTGTGYYQVEGDGSAVALYDFHAEVGKTSYWTFDSAKFYRNNTLTSGELSALIKLNNATVYSKYGIDIISTMSPGNTKRGYIFSKDFAIPLYVRGHKSNESFKTTTERTRSGNDFVDWIEAQEMQPIVIHDFQWDNLTATQLGVFEDFIEAFNGNIQQPFIMVRILDSGSSPNYEMEFWRLVPQDAVIGVDKNNSNLYSFRLTAQEQLVNF
jgi:hypothetical protein